MPVKEEEEDYIIHFYLQHGIHCLMCVFVFILINTETTHEQREISSFGVSVFETAARQLDIYTTLCVRYVAVGYASFVLIS
jgi:hypothetical protein